MTPHQVWLVQTSFAAIAPRAEQAAALFYGRLFALDPALRPLFPADLAGQRRKLVAALAAAVRGLGRPEGVRPMLEELGRRHAAYGVQDADYDTVGAALLGALAEALGAAFDDELRAAWTACHDLVATAMRDGARGVARAAAA